MKHLPYLLFSLLLTFSCKKELNKAIELEITESKLLVADAHKISVDLFRPSKLVMHKNKLIVYDDVRKDIFKVFDTDKMLYLYSFGENGSGPNEFVFTDKETINSSDYFEILDRSKLYYFHITDTMAFRMDSILFVTNNSAPTNNFKKISDSIYLFTNDGSSGKMDTEFTLYNTQQNSKEDFGKVVLFDKKLQDLSAIDLASVLIKSVVTNQKRIAAFYYHFPYFNPTCRFYSSKWIKNGKN
jgi:hypothetical protein